MLLSLMYTELPTMYKYLAVIYLYKWRELPGSSQWPSQQNYFGPFDFAFNGQISFELLSNFVGMCWPVKKIPSVSPPRLSSRRDSDRRRRHPRTGFPSLCPSPPALRRAGWARTVASSSRDGGVLAPSTGARRNPRYLFLTAGGGGEAHRLHPIGAPS